MVKFDVCIATVLLKRKLLLARCHQSIDFRTFIRRLNPYYQLPCRQTVKKHVMIAFSEERDLDEFGIIPQSYVADNTTNHVRANDLLADWSNELAAAAADRERDAPAQAKIVMTTTRRTAKISWRILK